MRNNLLSLLLGITAALLLPILARELAREQSRRQAERCHNNLKNVGIALEMYSTDFAGRYPKDDPEHWYTEEASLRQLTPNYLRAIPTCPSGSAYKVSTGV